MAEVHSLSTKSLSEWLVMKGIPQAVVDALYGTPGTISNG